MCKICAFFYLPFGKIFPGLSSIQATQRGWAILPLQPKGRVDRHDQPAQSQQVLKLTWKICTQPARFSGFEWEGEMRFIAFFGGKIKTPPNFWFFNWEVLWKEILYRNLKTTGLDFRHTDTRIQQTWDINHLLTFHIPNKHAHKPHMRKNTNFCMTPEIIFRYLFVRLHLAYMCWSFPQPYGSFQE